jgi:hypothetical protein
MASDSYAIQFEGRRLFLEMDTDSALQIAREAHVAIDSIPRGANTYWQIFATADGKLAALLQQSGFEERETDLGLEINGAMAVVGLDGQTQEDLDRYLDWTLKEK